jgi:imidazolonepropionase-like amidohydrolase
LINELKLLVKAGLSNFEALNSATGVSAQVLGFDKTGSVKTGYRVNLLLLAKNPLMSIKNLDTLTAVIIRGQLVDSDKINDLKLAARDTSFVRSLWRFLELQLFII